MDHLKKVFQDLVKFSLIHVQRSSQKVLKAANLPRRERVQLARLAGLVKADA